MIEKEYWEKFYTEKHNFPGSTWAHYCMQNFGEGKTVELGCGNGRDVEFLKSVGVKNIVGVDKSSGAGGIQMDVEDYIKEFESPDHVYTRFFWHSIDNELRDKILDWTKDMIYIEARTEQDKPKDLFGKHKRNLVEIKGLVHALKHYNFDIIYLSEGYGFSPFKEENPHLVRVIAKKHVFKGH